MNFPDSPGKEQNVLTTGTEIWIGQGLVDKAECSPFIWTSFGYLRCTDSLSELESIGRSNLTWPASPATELGRTVLITCTMVRLQLFFHGYMYTPVVSFLHYLSLLFEGCAYKRKLVRAIG